MSKRAAAGLLAVVTALALAAVAAPVQAALRHIDGAVVSKNAAAKTFRISTQSGNLRIGVNSSTRFERIPGGFGGLRKGMRIEVDAARTSNGLLAKHVEPMESGGGGEDDSGGGHGGSDDGADHT